MLKKLETFEPGPGLAYVLVMSAAFLWGMSIVIGRGVHEEIPPIGLSFWRWGLGALFLLPFVLMEVIAKAPLILRHLKLIVFMGAIQVGSSTLLFVAVNFTTAINASVINASQPALTAVAAWLLVKDKINTVQGLGILVGFIGIVTIVFRADLSVLVGLELNGGDGLAVSAIIGWAVYSVLLRRIPKELGVTTTLFLILFTGSVTVLPFYIWESLTIRAVPFTVDTLIVFLVLGLVVSVASIYVWNAGIRSIGPNKASIFLNLIPVSAALLAIIFLGEQLFAFHIIGGVLVAMGISLVIIRGMSKSEK